MFNAKWVHNHLIHSSGSLYIRRQELYFKHKSFSYISSRFGIPFTIIKEIAQGRSFLRRGAVKLYLSEPIEGKSVLTFCLGSNCARFIENLRFQMKVSAGYTDTSPLCLIGYWVLADEDKSEEDSPEYPNPTDLVDSSWLPDERHLLLSYLKRGFPYSRMWGYSWCRFNCGCSAEKMGAGLLTDGVWVWPEGLAHYVEHHSVVLPDAFIGHSRKNGWSMPSDVADLFDEFRRRSGDGGDFMQFLRDWAVDRAVDDTYWLDWGSDATGGVNRSTV